MPRAEASSFHNPFEHLGHAAREIPAWTGRHWKSVALALAALGVGGSSYMLVKSLSGGGHSESSNPSQPGITQLQQPPEVELGVEIAPYPTSTLQPEATATPTATPTPPETPVPTATATALPPKKEDLEPFDCVILSPEACALLRPAYRVNPDGSRDLLAFGANLPVGTRIYADITGEFAKTIDIYGSPFGKLTHEEPGTGERQSTLMWGRIEFTGKKTADGRFINETITTPGVHIATVTGTPDTPDGFNFQLNLNKFVTSTAKTSPDMERVNRYLPDLEERVPILSGKSTVVATATPQVIAVTDKAAQ